MTQAEDIQDIIDALEEQLISSDGDEEIIEDMILYYKQLLDSLPSTEGI